jgi:hypothetical protein
LIRGLVLSVCLASAACTSLARQNCEKLVECEETRETVDECVDVWERDWAKWEANPECHTLLDLDKEYTECIVDVPCGDGRKVTGECKAEWDALRSEINRIGDKC